MLYDSCIMTDNYSSSRRAVQVHCPAMESSLWVRQGLNCEQLSPSCCNLLQSADLSSQTCQLWFARPSPVQLPGWAPCGPVCESKRTPCLLRRIHEAKAQARGGTNSTFSASEWMCSSSYLQFQLYTSYFKWITGNIEIISESSEWFYDFFRHASQNYPKGITHPALFLLRDKGVNSSKLPASALVSGVCQSSLKHLQVGKANFYILTSHFST